MKNMMPILGLVLMIAGTFLAGHVLGDASDDPGGITLSAVLLAVLGLVVAGTGIVAFWLSARKRGG